MLSGPEFDGSTVGFAGVSTMCRPSSSGNINMCVSGDDVSVCGAAVAHEMGHNFGMHHDSSGNACGQSGEVMQAVIGGSAAPSEFSSCSDTCSTSFFANTYARNGECLENTPSHVYEDPVCGNGFVEKGEDCDCASADCSGTDVRCNGATCTFADSSYQCSDLVGACCSACAFVSAEASQVCRAARGTCDLAETRAGRLVGLPH